jgi:cystathionine beta-synthase
MSGKIQAYNNVLELIGETPLIKLSKTVEGFQVIIMPKWNL